MQLCPAKIHLAQVKGRALTVQPEWTTTYCPQQTTLRVWKQASEALYCRDYRLQTSNLFSILKREMVF